MLRGTFGTGLLHEAYGGADHDDLHEQATGVSVTGLAVGFVRNAVAYETSAGLAALDLTMGAKW